MNTPALVEGSVINPSHVTEPHASAARDFFNLIRDLLHRANFHNEGELNGALDVVSAYEKHVISPSDLRGLNTEGDRAAIEDVTKRVPPQSGLPVTAAPAGAQIDYAKLAAAIVAAQARSTQPDPAPSGEVHVVTDAAPSATAVSSGDPAPVQS